MLSSALGSPVIFRHRADRTGMSIVPGSLRAATSSCASAVSPLMSSRLTAAPVIAMRLKISSRSPTAWPSNCPGESSVRPALKLALAAA